MLRKYNKSEDNRQKWIIHQMLMEDDRNLGNADRRLEKETAKRVLAYQSKVGAEK
jgi:hypothetical protein